MLPSEFTFIQRGFFNCNSTLLHGRDGPVLIDSGHFLAVDETLDLIQEAGVEPESLVQIVSTHAHSDHHGANRTLQRLSGAPIGLSALTDSWFRHGERRLTWFSGPSHKVDLVPADIVYRHGDQIELSGVPFTIIGLPGHAPDCIGFYQPDTKLLISADALWENDLGVLNTAVHGWDAVAEAELAIRRILDLEVEVAIPGHGGLVTDPQTACANVMRRLERFRRSPTELSQHLVRRLTMYELLYRQPIQMEHFVEMQANVTWILPYLSDLKPGLPPNQETIAAVYYRNYRAFYRSRPCATG